MSLHTPTRWILTYDITDPRRGVRVHRYMKSQGVPLQYSVFTVEASAAQMRQLMLALEALDRRIASGAHACNAPASRCGHSTS